MENNKARWYGPKQIGMIIYTAVLFLIGTSIIGGNNNTVFPIMAEARGWDINLINVVSGIGCMLEGIGVLVFARVIKKFGAKIVIVLGLFATAVLTCVFGQTQSMFVFFVVILVIGLLGGTYSKGGGMVLTANWWPTKKGIVLGFSTMGIVLMNILYVPNMPKLFGAFGINNGMFIIAIIIAAVAVFSIFYVKNTPEEAGTYPDGDPAFSANGNNIGQMMKEYVSPFTFKKICADKNTWLIGLGSCFAFIAAMSFIASTIPILIGFGYAPTFGTTVFAVGGVVSIIGSFLFGVIDQKVGTKKAFIIYFICIIIGFVFAFVMNRAAIFVWIASIILFAAQGSLCNLLPSYVATKYGRWDYTSGYQVIGTIFNLGGGIGVMITGMFGNPFAMYTFDIVILVIGLVMMALSNDSFVGKRD